MTRRQWNRAAATFEDEVFDITRVEHGGRLKRIVAGHCVAGAKVAVDLGCGLGSMTRLLARLCPAVYGVDYADRVLGRAQLRPTRLGTIEWVLADIRRTSHLVPRADVVTCINVITSPSAQVRRGVFASAFEIADGGGVAIFVVAALESALYVERVTRPRRRAPALECRPTGLIPRGGVVQKHFARGELVTSVARAGFVDARVSRAVYDWAEETDERRRTASLARPWDWIVEARRPP